jgi:DNA polymerase-3 subunit gamma/tau
LQFNLKRLPLSEIRDHLLHILKEEGIDAESGAADEIARAADGSMRDALSLLDQAIAHGGGALQAAAVREMLGTIDCDRVIALLRALAAGDAARLLEEAAALAELSPNYAEVLNDLNGALVHIALAQAAPGALADDVEHREALLELVPLIEPEDVQLYYQIGLTGRRDLPLAPEPRSGFEMTLLRMLAFRPASSRASAAAPSGQERTAQAAPAAPVQKPGPPPLKPQAIAAPDSASLPNSGALDWNELANNLPLAGLARQLVLNCSVLRYEDGHIELALDATQRALLSKKSEAQLVQALTAHLGREIKLEMHLQEQMQAQTPMQQQQLKAQIRQDEALQAIETDDGVRSLLEQFDGSIEAGSVRPLD